MNKSSSARAWQRTKEALIIVGSTLNESRMP
jgi:hypothetical protein